MSSTLDLPCLDRPQGLCRTCSTDVEGVVLDLVADFDELSAAIGRRAPGVDGPMSANKPQSTPPINLLIDAIRSRLVYTAACWEEILRDHCGLSTRRAGAVRERQSLVQSVRVIAPRVDVLAALSDTDGYFDGAECGLVRRNGLEGIRSLVRLHEGIHRTLGHAAVVVVLPGVCSCGAERLSREVGSDTVWCASCDGRWTYAEYTAQVRMLIA